MRRETQHSRAFTMVEVLATIAIMAVLVAVMVPAIGNYVETSRKTADKQTLTVLNEALTRYKTQGGDMTALTSGARIGNVLTKLQTAVTWAGMKHQFLKTGQTYLSANIDAIGEGRRYRFTRYGSYSDGSVIGSDILKTVASAGYDVGDEAAFDNWITQAMAETGSTNYLVLTNPDTTDRIRISTRVATSGAKVRVWWGDGTTQDYNSISTSSSTTIAKVFASAAKRTVIVVGDLGYIYSASEGGYTGESEFGGSVSTMPCLTVLSVGGNNTLSGNIGRLTGLTNLNVGGSNTLSGDVSGLTDLTFLNVWGSNTVSGDVGGLTGLTFLNVQGSNTLSGDVSGLTDLTILGVGGSNTVSGNVSGLTSLTFLNAEGSNTLSGSVSGFPLQFLSLQGNSTIDVASVVSVSSTATKMSYFELNNNYLLNQTQVDAILANFWANRDVFKPRSDRFIDINEANHAVPSAAGLTTKANLQAYKSPYNTGATEWTVNTN